MENMAIRKTIFKDLPLLGIFLACSVERGKMDVQLPEEAIIPQVVEEKNLISLNDINQINLVPASVLFFLVSVESSNKNSRRVQSIHRAWHIT